MSSSLEERPRKPILPPEDLATFRNIGRPEDNYVIPEISENRKVTNLKFTIVFALTILLLLPFLIYTLIYADLNRLTHGFDDCGNVCGKKNPAVGGISCSGKDMTEKPFLDVNDTKEIRSFNLGYFAGICVDTCRYGHRESNRCFHPKDPQRNSSGDNSFGKVFMEISTDLQKSAWRIVAMYFISLGTCVVMVFLFKLFPGAVAVVWFIFGGTVIVTIPIIVYLWIYFFVPGVNTISITICVTAAVIIFVIILIMAFLFKKIKLLIRLFNETLKVVFQMPHILVLPVLSFVSSVTILVIVCFVGLMMSTAGVLEQVGTTDIYVYSLNVTMLVSMLLLVLVFVWMFQFIMGCQHMVVAGAVSAYYFTRDKASIKSPVYTSFYNLVKYHIGTVALGSLILAAVAIFKFILYCCARNKYLECFVQCCMGIIEDFLRYLTKNAYIQTAMHGQPFFKSGKRAVCLLYANLLDAIVVSSVLDFIFTLAAVMMVAITVALGLAISDKSLNYHYVGLLIAGVVAALQAWYVFSLFETAVDTVFLCFCEDKILNDGVNRAYYMTTDLMQSMEEAKVAFNKNNQNQT